ncbi:hypothetical protein Ancab_006658, partial [Ancistrocladus abbreviatus]
MAAGDQVYPRLGIHHHHRFLARPFNYAAAMAASKAGLLRVCIGLATSPQSLDFCELTGKLRNPFLGMELIKPGLLIPFNSSPGEERLA